MPFWRFLPYAQHARAPIFLQTPDFALGAQLSVADYTQRVDQLAAQRYRLSWVQTDSAGEQVSFAALWMRDNITDWAAQHGLSGDDYLNLSLELGAEGYHAVCISGYTEAEALYYAGVWVRDTPGDVPVAWRAFHQLTLAQLQEKLGQFALEGFQLSTINAYIWQDTVYFAAVWRQEPTTPLIQPALAVDDYPATQETLSSQNYRPAFLSGYLLDTRAYIAGAWRQDSLPPEAWWATVDMQARQVYPQSVQQAQQDFEPVCISQYTPSNQQPAFAAVWVKKQRVWQATGDEAPELRSFDETMREYMQKYTIPNGALAVTKDGRLVLARAYNWQTANHEPIQPDALFRIASISKPLTATAIFRLMQENRLELFRRVSDLLELDAPEADPRWRDVTVLHLLQHTGGWDRQNTFDPMFADRRIAEALEKPLPITREDIISYMLKRPLDFDPGVRVAYSNYGYCLLGRLIEKITGQPYERYVRESILNPLKIQRMRLGNSRLELRARDEVVYYTEMVEPRANVLEEGAPLNALPGYGTFNLENLDSNGGWLASAPDLARFAVTFDDFERSPLLNAASIRAMFAEPPTGEVDGKYYGCGWDVRPIGDTFNTWHIGNLPGTFTLLSRRYDGINWIALFNRRDVRNWSGFFDIDEMLHPAANVVTRWPDHDWFSLYFPAT